MVDVDTAAAAPHAAGVVDNDIQNHNGVGTAEVEPYHLDPDRVARIAVVAVDMV